MFFCPICKDWQHGEPNFHHIFKKAIFGEGEVIGMCRTPCHNVTEEIIRIKENDILRMHPEIYTSTIDELINGKYNLWEVEKSIHKRRKEKDRRYYGKRNAHHST